MEQRELGELAPRQGRRDTDLPALAYRHDGSQLCARLSNIGYDGCELSSEESFSIGGRIRLTVPKLGEIHAEVRWVRSDLNKAGALFLSDGIDVSDQHSSTASSVES